MQINPYLTFNGNCAAAFKFYEKELGGKIMMMAPMSETPMAGNIPEGERHLIMHASLKLGENLLMGSDCNSQHPYKPLQGIQISLHVKEPAEAERVFAALSAGGTVQMALQQTFWARRFGMCVDQFGVPWMLNCE